MLKKANLSFSVSAQSYTNDVDSIKFSTQDKNSAKLVFTIKHDKEPLNLTDIEGKVDLIMGDKSPFDDGVAIVTDPLKGILEYTITPEQIRHPGRARGELQLVHKDGSSVGGFRFTFTVNKALLDEYAGPIKEFYINDLEAVKEEARKKVDEIQAISDSIADVDVVRIDTRLGELEEQIGEGVGVDEQARQGIEGLTEQLAEMPNHLSISFPSTKTLFIAHRGMSNIAPENTIPAFEHAGALGMYGIETDIIRCKTGEWVIMHDMTVDRTTNGTGNVVDMTLTQLKELVIDTGANIALYPNLRIPTLEEYLVVCKAYGVMPVIEIKADTDFSQYFGELIGIIRKYGLEDRCSFTTGTHANALALRSHSKKVIIHRLSTGTDTELEQIKTIGNAIADIQHTNLNAEVVRKYNQAGIPITAWAMSNLTQVQSMINLGVDYISSDNYGGF